MRWSFRKLSVLGVGLWAALILSLGGACTPNYPKCDKDEHCRREGQRPEFCVNGQCQQCRPGLEGQMDCPDGQECKSGRCEGIPGYCKTNADCPGKVCENNRCTACKNDGQCPGGRCNEGTCEKETRKACKSYTDCAESEDCVNGFCTPANRGGGAGGGKPSCNLDTVYFDFNESVLSAEATSVIDRNAECIKREKKNAALTGHSDPRGTQEYNLALSERRAQSVKERLQRMGVNAALLTTIPRGELDAVGTEETSWARDRRVEFQWR